MVFDILYVMDYNDIRQMKEVNILWSLRLKNECEITFGSQSECDYISAHGYYFINVCILIKERLN